MTAKQRRVKITDILLIVVSAFFLIGICTFFGPCGPKEDGSWMTCHWAGHAVAGIVAVLLVISLVRLFVKSPQTKMGLNIATIPVAALAAILPGNLIGLCMMDSMTCHAVMRPAVIACSIIVIVLCLVDVFLQRKQA